MICEKCGEKTEAGKPCPNCGTVSYPQTHIVPSKLILDCTAEKADCAALTQPIAPKEGERTKPQRQSTFLWPVLCGLTIAVLAVSLILVTVNSSKKQAQLQHNYQQQLSQNTELTGQINSLTQQVTDLTQQVNDLTENKESSHHIVLVDTREIGIPGGSEIYEVSELANLPDYEDDGDLSFLGWNIEPDGSGEYLKKLSENDRADDLVLYAVWGPKETTSKTVTENLPGTGASSDVYEKNSDDYSSAPSSQEEQLPNSSEATEETTSPSSGTEETGPLTEEQPTGSESTEQPTSSAAADESGTGTEELPGD